MHSFYYTDYFCEVWNTFVSIRLQNRVISLPITNSEHGQSKLALTSKINFKTLKLNQFSAIFMYKIAHSLAHPENRYISNNAVVS